MNNNNVAGGIGVLDVLGIVFIVLKLSGIVEWSWIWVLSPFWIGLCLAVLLIIIAVILGLLSQ